ncbi:MAG: hypothetical protein FWF81_13150 [Defluviitaleaceae bacterium]|nr:hypothetical protein [Defluviitaleaceae bacterium]
MNTDLIQQYPQLAEILDITKIKRREEILENLRANNCDYKDILTRRAKQSIILLDELSKDANCEYEKYMDLVYEQTIYEMDIIYENAFLDAVELLRKFNMIV